MSQNGVSALWEKDSDDVAWAPPVSAWSSKPQDLKGHLHNIPVLRFVLSTSKSMEFHPNSFQFQKPQQWTKIICGAFNYVTKENVVSKGFVYWSSPTPTAVSGRAPIDASRSRIRVVGNCFENQMEKNLWTTSPFPLRPLFTNPHPSLGLPSCGEMMH